MTMALTNIACRRIFTASLSGVHNAVVKRAPASVSKYFSITIL